MKYLALLAGTLYLFACSDKKSGTDDCDPEEYEHTIKANSRIDTLTGGSSIFSFQVNSDPNKNVFIYTHTSERCKMVADAGYRETLVFEVPANANSFSYTNDELKNANTYYKMSCYCDVNARMVVQGTIKGQKISAAMWTVEADLTMPLTNKNISFNKSFTMQ